MDFLIQIILIVCFCGAAGGACHSLISLKNETDAWHIKQKNAGQYKKEPSAKDLFKLSDFLLSVLVGMASSIVGVAFMLNVTNMEIPSTISLNTLIIEHHESLNIVSKSNEAANKSDIEEIIETLHKKSIEDIKEHISAWLYLFAVAIIGGYAGGSLMDKLYSSMMNKFEEIEDKINNVDTETSHNSEHIEQLSADLNQSEARRLQRDGHWLDSLNKINQAIVVKPSATNYAIKALSQSYLNGDQGLRDSLITIDRALLLLSPGDETDSSLRFNLLYNKAAITSYLNRNNDFSEYKETLIDCFTKITQLNLPKRLESRLKSDFAENGDFHHNKLEIVELFPKFGEFL